MRWIPVTYPIVFLVHLLSGNGFSCGPNLWFCEKTVSMIYILPFIMGQAQTSFGKFTKKQGLMAKNGEVKSKRIYSHIFVLYSLQRQ
jgi:hypothetical protein